MSKYQKKLAMLERIPNCTRCGCKMIVTQDEWAVNRGRFSHAATIKNFNGVETLICYQCNRVLTKEKEIAALPLIPRLKKRIEKRTGLFTFIRHIRKSINWFYYFKIRRGVATGRMPVK